MLVHDVEANAIDTSLTTKWTSNTSSSATITFDLGAQSKVDTVKVMFDQGNTIKYFFTIQSSIDGTTWTNIGGARTSTTSSGGGGGSATGIVKDYGNIVVSAPKIKMIYWGPTWSAGETPSKATIDSNMQTLISSPYFSKLIQYRSIRPPTWGGSFIYSGTTPPASYTIEQAKAPIEALMNANTIPKVSADPNCIYMVITPNTCRLASGAAGQHTITDYTGVGAGIIFYGTAWNQPGIFQDTRVIAEEIVESMTSPGSVGLEGFLIAPPIGHEMNPNYPAEQYVEINDACAQLFDTVNGVSVFPYYSNQDGACIIPGAANFNNGSPVSGTPTSGLNEFPFTEITARFIRLLCQGNNQGTGNTATENITRILNAEIWGRQAGGGTTPPPTGGGGTGTDPGNTGGGTGTPATPPPVVTVYKDFSDSYHLGLEEGDFCGLGDDPANKDLEEIYEANPGNVMYIRLAMPQADCLGADAMVGELAATEASTLVGAIPRQLTVVLKRTGSCDGYIFARIWDQNLQVMQDLGSYPALAVNFGSDMKVTFTNLFANYAMKKGDVIGIEYDDPSSNCDNYIAYRHCDTNAEDAMNSIFVKFRDHIVTDPLLDFAAQIGA